jgi:hypothetical protein
MATIKIHATGVEYEATGPLLDYYQGEANTVGGISIDGVDYPAKAAVASDAEVESGQAFDPSDHNIDDVQAYLANATDEERARVLEAERAGKARKTLLDAPGSFDPAGHSVEDVQAYLASADEDEQARVLAAERARGDAARKSLVGDGD